MEIPKFPWSKEGCWICIEGDLRNELWCNGELISTARVAFDDLWIEDFETGHEAADSICEMMLKLLAKASTAIVMREVQLKALRQRLEEQQISLSQAPPTVG
jgi:hypothetical protein